ncbi:hypothetical protein EV174_006247 [Coemansia sp. RSA 2320]|nr:hypothetical protein EV174_006247 [Coemansia sp. RSA 2320]
MSLTVYVPTFGGNTYYFPSKSPAESDTPFLAYVPGQSVAYGVGGVFAALGIASVSVLLLSRAGWYAGSVVASACGMVSLFLRGALLDRSSVAMYIASYVLDSVAAYVLVFTALLMGSRWVRHVEAGRTAFAALLAALGGVALVGCVVLESVALPLAFRREPWYRHIGHILHISSAAATLAASAIGLLVAAWKAATSESATAAEAAGLGGAFALLTAWGCFALAQTKMPLDAVANRSEAAWFLLNVLPLALVLLLWTLVNAPRVFAYAADACQLPPAYHRRQQWCEYPEHEYSYPLRKPGVPSELIDEDRIRSAMQRYA